MFAELSILVWSMMMADPLPGAPAWQLALHHVVLEESRRKAGEITLFVKDLPSESSYSFNGHRASYLASGVKILVLLAVVEQIQVGRLRWTDRLKFKRADVRDGAPVLTRERVGEAFFVRELIDYMMAMSDNAATDLLIKRVGLGRVNRAAQRFGGAGFSRITTLLEVRYSIYRFLDLRADLLSPQEVSGLREQGSLQARVNRFAELIGADREAFTPEQLREAHQFYYQMGINSASLEAMGGLLERLARGKVIDAIASQKILEIMSRCQTGDRRIRAGLPTAVLLAHKTGTQFERICDLGVFYLAEDHPVVFAGCLKNFSDLKKAESVLARLAQTAYQLLADTDVRKRGEFLCCSRGFQVPLQQVYCQFRTPLTWVGAGVDWMLQTAKKTLRLYAGQLLNLIERAG